jgi:8-amino-7-oxononanoate synthase
MKAKYQLKLEDRMKNGGLRSLSLLGELVDFFSNDYLGFSQNSVPVVHQGGSTGSRLLSGNSREAEQAEATLADFFGTPAALVFNSGYDANLGFFSSVPQRGDTVLYDALVHASVRDGIRLSHADAFAFKHNDGADLTKKIARAKGTVFVAVESLYSMDGDLAPLREFSEICKSAGAKLVVDEAHAGGVLGPEGKGLVAELDLAHEVFARVFTFGKAYGAHGACVVGDEELIAYLVNFARSLIYTTAMPPAQYLEIEQAILRSKVDLPRRQLQENLSYFREIFRELELISDARSPVQVIQVNDAAKAVLLAETLQQNGLAVKAILSPTVPEGAERLRICVHAFNTPEEIDRLKAVLSAF